jgi:class 3 adenylate cyclase
MAARFDRGRYSPALFDIAQDITGGLPIKLVERWLESDQTHDDALGLLESHRVVGFNVVSDSAGLTRLTQQYGLMEILAIINQPKEIVYRVGTAIGGAGVGIWAADNTQMFYPEGVAAEALVAALLSIQDEVLRRCTIKIGIGAHFGGFYSVAGGLFGEESDAIEEFAENATGGGEVVISQAVRDRLPADHGFTLVERGGGWPTMGAVYTVTDGPRLADVPEPGGHYPIPYSESFYADLVRLEARIDDAALAHAMSAKYTHDKAVVLIEREGEAGGDSHEVAMFNNMALSAMMKDAGLRHLNEDHGEEIKVVGGLGIYTFDDPALALAFAETFRRELSGDGIHCRIGLDFGPVLVFALAGGGRDIAGNPVNVASKMAQDRGHWGKIYLSERMYERVDVRGFQPITYTISGVDLVAFEG